MPSSKHSLIPIDSLPFHPQVLCYPSTALVPLSGYTPLHHLHPPGCPAQRFPSTHLSSNPLLPSQNSIPGDPLVSLSSVPLFWHHSFHRCSTPFQHLHPISFLTHSPRCLLLPRGSQTPALTSHPPFTLQLKHHCQVTGEGRERSDCYWVQVSLGGDKNVALDSCATLWMC